MRYHFYAYESPTGDASCGIAHRFASHYDRERWLEHGEPRFYGGSRGTLTRAEFDRMLSEQGAFIEHENGDVEGYEYEI